MSIVIDAPTRAGSRSSRRKRLATHPLGLRIEGIEARVERRQLDRHVDPRQPPAIVPVEARQRRASLGQSREIGDQSLVASEHRDSLGLADDRFADEVDRERHRFGAKASSDFAKRPGVVRRDEAASQGR